MLSAIPGCYPSMKFGQSVTKLFNFTYPRRVDGSWIKVPVLGGLKLGIRGELFLLEILKQLLPHLDGAVLDIGANVGQTLAKIKLAESNRRYYGFEPNASCFAYLERLVADNGWNDVTLFPFGLSDGTEILALQVADDLATDGRGTFVANIRSDSVATHTKHAVVVDFAAIDHLIEDKIALIKVDVEGAELDVLIGLHDRFTRDRPVLCIEMLPIESLIDRHIESVELLQSLDYEVYVVMKHPNKRLAGLRSISHYECFDDAWCSDFVAVHNNSLSLLDRSSVH